MRNGVAVFFNLFVVRVGLSQEEYRRRLEENLTMDSEGKPFKMLAFKGNPKCHGGRLRVLDEMMQVEQGQSNVTKTLRSLPKV